MISTPKSSEHPPSLILVGFDRSGTSAISRALSSHPDVELFMQPFNSGPVRRKMNILWEETTASPEDISFFADLAQGKLRRDYICSPWFDQSTTTQFIPGRLHIVKTTLNHMLVPWCLHRFPALPHWAIWREPLDILASLIRNDFIQSWYRQALDEITPSVIRSPDLSVLFGSFLSEATTPEREAALLIAIRSFVLFQAVKPENVLSYELFAQNQSAECDYFFSAQGMAAHPVQVAQDANIIGKPPQLGRSHQDVISVDGRKFSEAVFAPLYCFRPKRGGRS